MIDASPPPDPTAAARNRAGAEGQASAPLDPPFFAEPPIAEAPTGADPALALVARYLDPAFYLGGFPTDTPPPADPAAHFHAVGWKDGRDPAPWFDTTHYLAANADIRRAGVDPFVHYLRAGRAEWRAPRRPGGSRRAALDAAQAAADLAPPALPRLDSAGLAATLTAACAGRPGLEVVVADRIWPAQRDEVTRRIAAEEDAAAAAGRVHLRLTPLPGADGTLVLHLDGRAVAVAADTGFLAAIAALPPPEALPRRLVLHGLADHRPALLADIAWTLAPETATFWLHDHASLCRGRTLLRNDVAYCAAPPAASMACRICVHGADRLAYLADVETLFAVADLTVKAGAQAALDAWRAAAPGLRHRGAEVALPPTAALQPRPARPGPASIAFLGMPTVDAGWPCFADLVRRSRGSGLYEFLHIAAPDQLRPAARLRCVPLHDGAAPLASVLAAEDIDLVVLPAAWPDPCTDLARAAHDAGAGIVTLAVNAPAASLINETGHGVALDDEARLIAFFRDGDAADYAARQRTTPRPGCAARQGTVASPPLGLTVSVRGRVVPGTPEGDRVLFPLPEDAGDIRIVSSSRYLSGDEHRRLGLAIAGIWLDGAPVPPGDPRRRRGWHGAPAGAPVQWTSGDATLEAGGARLLALALA